MARNNPWHSPTLTKESHGEAVNINTLAARALAGQAIPQNTAEPQYGDHTRHQDLQSSLDFVQYHKEQFAALPPQIRAEFRNDPVNLLQFMEAVEEDLPGARARGLTLGLIEATKDESAYIKAVDRQKAKDKLDADSPPPPPPPPPKPSFPLDQDTSKASG